MSRYTSASNYREVICLYWGLLVCPFHGFLYVNKCFPLVNFIKSLWLLTLWPFQQKTRCWMPLLLAKLTTSQQAMNGRSLSEYKFSRNNATSVPHFIQHIPQQPRNSTKLSDSAYTLTIQKTQAYILYINQKRTTRLRVVFFSIKIISIPNKF